MTVSNLIIGRKESVTDELLLLNPYQIPITNFLGFGLPVLDTTHKWYEDALDAFKDIVNGAVAIDGTTVTVENGALFKADSVIKIGNELLFVTVVNGNALTVTRGYGNTTPAIIADDAEVEIMFNLKDEGSDARESSYTARKPVTNITQIFDEAIDISGTAQAIAQYGIDNLYLTERMKKQDQLAMSLENALVNGIKFELGKKRMMGGLRQMISTNVYDATTSALTYAMIDNMMLELFQTGAMKQATNYALICSPTQRNALTELDKTAVRITQGETSVGRVVESVKTNYGNLPLIPNINFKADEMAIVDGNRGKIRPLSNRSFTHTYLGTTGDKVKGQIVGEYTLELNQEAACAWFKNLAVS